MKKAKAYYPEFNYSDEDIDPYKEGDIITLGGKRYMLEKKYSRNIQIKRFYWFDYVGLWMVKQYFRLRGEK